MAYKKIAKGSDEWEIMRGLFLLCERHLGVEDTQEYWAYLTEDVNEFIQSNKGHPLAQALGLALVEYLDKTAQAERGVGGCQKQEVEYE